MSAAAPTAQPPDRRQRLPEWLRPRDEERRGRGDLRRVESTLLVLAFLLLAVVVVNDVVRQVHVNERLSVDLRTWRQIVGRVYPAHAVKNISIEQDLVHYTTRDVLCGNIGEGPPGTLPQVCLIMTGPTVHGMRAAKGGFYLPPYFQDKRLNRYACWGTAVRESLCGLPTPPGAPDEPLTDA
ncbi:MAG TPA: hypothetical protein VNV37_03805 [Solirubrobacteraceae bacterium]|jgi:hypothetical protein|nr:hypothetical protein [Solirubrobacteraceae bacterium]